ncbi:MAG: hypothetical protein U5K27_02515 [Desulfotignum sp.]|nr:hypothetical protein [Desulfotignum sp.]
MWDFVLCPMMVAYAFKKKGEYGGKRKQPHKGQGNGGLFPGRGKNTGDNLIPGNENKNGNEHRGHIFKLVQAKGNDRVFFARTVLPPINHEGCNGIGAGINGTGCDGKAPDKKAGIAFMTAKNRFNTKA